MAAVRDRIDDFPPNTLVVLATFTALEHLSGYTVDIGDRVVVGSDPDRSVYRAYGLGRGNRLRAYGARASRAYMSIMVRGEGWPRKPIEDSLQLGGNVVIDATGTLRWVFRGEGPDDRPSVDTLIDQAFEAWPAR